MVSHFSSRLSLFMLSILRVLHVPVAIPGYLVIAHRYHTTVAVYHQETHQESHPVRSPVSRHTVNKQLCLLPVLG